VVPVAGRSFPDRFDHAFAAKDRQGGGRNLVSLVHLRAALGNVGRETFDRELRELRKAGRYALVAVEDLRGISVEEKSAAIKKDGELLLYVSRKA
jgi:hypothetical protein